MLFEHLSRVNHILIHLDVPEQVHVTHCAWKKQVRSDSHKPMKSTDADHDTKYQPQDLLYNE